MFDEDLAERVDDLFCEIVGGGWCHIFKAVLVLNCLLIICIVSLLSVHSACTLMLTIFFIAQVLEVIAIWIPSACSSLAGLFSCFWQ